MSGEDSKQIAKSGGLRYVSDTKPGFTRKKGKDGFLFYDAKGKRITDPGERERIKRIGIPPAYERVWICPHENGHIQATGFDARGRKQYRYHTRWREVRDEAKFQHILRFGEKLPDVRKTVLKHLSLPGMPRQKALAAVVRLLEITLIRVGNAEYAKKNESFGLTTIRDEHVDVHGSKIRFHFKGKSGKSWDLSISDRRIAKAVQQCAELPGQELFKYQDEQGKVHDVESGHVNQYLHEIAGEEFTAKDFRTWAGTVLAAVALSEFEKYDSAAQAKKNVVKAIEHVSGRLGNTPAICRKCYVHPEVFTAYLDAGLSEMTEQKIDQAFRKEYGSLTDDEVMVLAFLKRRLRSPAA